MLFVLSIRKGTVRLIKQLPIKVTHRYASSFLKDGSLSASVPQCELAHRISVAPMIDVSTSHFIHLLRLIGGESPQIYTEMYVDRAIIKFHQTGTLEQRLGIEEKQADSKGASESLSASESFLNSRENNVVQLGGSEPELLAQATKILVPYLKYSAINLNLGCPSTSVQAGMFGAILMKDIGRVIDCLNAMQESTNGQVPVTAKCRLGVDDLDSEEFIFNFIDSVSSKTKVTHFIIHARKCLLKGLSPAKNRSIPPLNYERVQRLASAFPDITFTLNGGLQDLDGTEKQLTSGPSNLSGVMFGRKVKDHPMVLGDLVKKFINPSYEIPSSNTIYTKYIEYVISQLIYGHKLGFLMLPLHNVFSGTKGRLFRTNMHISQISQFNSTDYDSPKEAESRARRLLEKLRPLL